MATYWENKKAFQKTGQVNLLPSFTHSAGPAATSVLPSEPLTPPIAVASYRDDSSFILNSRSKSPEEATRVPGVQKPEGEFLLSLTHSAACEGHW